MVQGWRILLSVLWRLSSFCCVSRLVRFLRLVSRPAVSSSTQKARHAEKSRALAAKCVYLVFSRSPPVDPFDIPFVKAPRPLLFLISYRQALLWLPFLAPLLLFFYPSLVCVCVSVLPLFRSGHPVGRALFGASPLSRAARVCASAGHSLVEVRASGGVRVLGRPRRGRDR